MTWAYSESEATRGQFVEGAHLCNRSQRMAWISGENGCAQTDRRCLSRRNGQDGQGINRCRPLLWTVQRPTSIDALAVLTVAATQTSTIRLGTSVLPTYPRHPLAAIAQVSAFNELAPGRLRLGIGPSHRPIIEDIYGIEMTAPLAHTREYLSVLRAALWEGKVSYHGRF